MTFTWARNVLPYLPPPVTTPRSLTLTQNQFTVASSTAAVRWAAATGGSGAISYRASFSPATPGCSATNLTNPYYGCDTLIPAMTYTISVVARDSNGDVSRPATLTFTTKS